jgi:hypothetical protein
MSQPQKMPSSHIDPVEPISPQLRRWLDTTSYPPDQVGHPDGPPPELPDDPEDDE